MNRKERIFACLAVLGILMLACAETAPLVDEGQPTASKAEQDSMPAPAPGATQQTIFLPGISSNAESYSQTAPGDTSTEFDPRVEISADRTQLATYEEVVITARPHQIGLPFYYLNVRDEGVQDVPEMVRISYDGQVEYLEGTSNILEFVSATAQMDQVTITMRAKAPGFTTVSVTATGEVHAPEGATWSGEGSGGIVIEVISP